MNTALKEWASVVEAMATGRQIMLLRKGGIVEADRGGFQVRYRQFLFFPTFEHQHRQWLKPEFAEVAAIRFPDLATEVPLEASAIAEPAARQNPTGIEISLLAEVTDVFTAPSSLEELLSMGSAYVWNEEFIRMRYVYRPDLPMYVLLLRAQRLARPQRIPNRPSYAGCKSWVHLTEEIDIADLSPVLNDQEYENQRRALRMRLCAS